jgi:hypothetical protein
VSGGGAKTHAFTDASWTCTATNLSRTTGTRRVLCPDLLSIRDLGEADGWRGRVVRAFFRTLRLLTGV